MLRDMATSKSMAHRASSSWSPRNATLDVNAAPTLPKALAEIVVTSQGLVRGGVSSDVGLGR
jgi:hypothetical protein